MRSHNGGSACKSECLSFIDCKYSAALEVNPSRAARAVSDNYSTLSSFNHMLMSSITHNSKKMIIYALFWCIYTAISLWLFTRCWVIPSQLCLLDFWAQPEPNSSNILNPGTQRLWILFHKLLPLWITGQLGVNPSSDWVRSRMAEDANVT